MNFQNTNARGARNNLVNVSKALTVSSDVFYYWLGERFWPNPDTLNLTLDGWLYAFFIGWAVHFARNRREQALVLALTVSIAFAHFGVFTGRAYWLVPPVCQDESRGSAEV